MEVPEITAVFFAQEEAPMALLFGPECVVPGRRVAISCLGPNFDRIKVGSFTDIISESFASDRVEIREERSSQWIT